MKKLLRKKAEDVPNRSQRLSPKPPVNGTPQTPLYARFASTQNAFALPPAISGPAPLSARVDSHTRIPGYGQNEAKQSYTPPALAPAFTSRNVDKPLPDADSKGEKRLPDPVPSALSDKSSAWRSDIPLVVEFKNMTLLENDTTESEDPHSMNPEGSPMPSRSSVELRESNNMRPNGGRSSSTLSSSSSIPRLNASVPQKRETTQERTRPQIHESRSGSGPGLATPPDSPSHNASRRAFSPMAAFGLVRSHPEKASNNESNSLQSSTTTLSLSQPDPVKNQVSPNNAQPPVQRQFPQHTPAPQRLPPSQRILSPQKSNLDNVNEQHPASLESPAPVGFPSQPARPASQNIPQSRRESLYAAFNGPVESMARDDSPERSRVSEPFGPRASFNNGPSSLVQGQPRIFAPMAMNSVPDSQEPFLRPGQPRIFTVTNPDTSPPRSPPHQEHSRYPSPPLTNPPSSPGSHNETAPKAFQIEPTRDRNSLSMDTNPMLNTSAHKRGTSNRYQPPSQGFSNHSRQQSLDDVRIGDETRTSPPRDIKGKGPAVPRRPFFTEPQNQPTVETSTHHLKSIPLDRDTKGNARGAFQHSLPQHQSRPVIDDIPPTDRSSKAERIQDTKSKALEAPWRPFVQSPHKLMIHSGSLEKGSDFRSSFDAGGFLLDNSAHELEASGNLKVRNNGPEIQSPQKFITDTHGINHNSLERHILDPNLLGCLLQYLTFYEWLVLYSVKKTMRTKLTHSHELKEEVLESYLRTIGYLRWIWEEAEPLTLSLRDLSEYMRGVSIPIHQYARISEAYLQARSSNISREEKAVFTDQARTMSFAGRAYSRVVIRLRLQAEAVARHARPTNVLNGAGAARSRPQTQGTTSRTSSRAPSPSSSFSHPQPYASRPSTGNGHGPVNSASSRTTFTSPIYRPRRAPLLRVFVPSPEGDWLSDASVIECEAELKRAGIVHLLRPGDTVWDVAVGDEGNAGRMIWNGAYLLDLDYSYSSAGDLPQYLPSLAFSPSYFHRVIRIVGNPIVHIDLAPWAEHITTNIKLLQDRIKTETPQGNYHTVVRWVHRSNFEIHPPHSGKKIPIPFDSGNWTIDRGWYGTVVVEAEGTNEGLADLWDRCKGPIPPHASDGGQNSTAEEGRKVFKILRERSKPGEIWIRTETQNLSAALYIVLLSALGVLVALSGLGFYRCGLTSTTSHFVNSVLLPTLFLYSVKMGYFQMTRASVRSLGWRRKRCPSFVALMNDDADAVVITAFKSLPFCCHADLLVMPLDELISVAQFLNTYLPIALRIDVRCYRSAVQIRHSIESIVGYRRSAPDAMRVPFSMDSFGRQRRSPKTPVSPLAMKLSPRKMEVPMLGQPRSIQPEEEADSSEIVMDSFPSRRRTPNLRQAATLSAVPKSAQMLRTPVRTHGRPFSSVSSRRSAAAANRDVTASSHTTPHWLGQSYSYRHGPYTPIPTSQGKSPRTPTLDMTDMDLLVSAMMSMSVSRPSVSVSVGEFGVLN